LPRATNLFCVSEPNFDRFLTALHCQEPDRVPPAELKVENEVKAAFLGRPFPDPAADLESYLRADVEFTLAAGYDYIRIAPPVSYPRRDVARTHDYGVYGGAARTRAWAAEHRGPIADRADFDAFPFPTADDVDYRWLEVGIPLVPPAMGVLTSIKGGGIWERVWMAMGFETFCFTLRDDPGLVADLFERFGRFYCEAFARAAAYPRVAGLWLGDDLAYTEGLMISPDIYRRHLFPWYREIAAICRQRDLAFIFHSDGDLWPILDDLLDIGIVALHPIEPKAMDIAELKRAVGRRLCLIGNIDLGYTLTRGTPEEVEAEVRQRIRDVAPGGGYCVGSSNTVTEYVPLANYRAMLAATERYGRYPIGA
jgi:uroporphyrinogen decarboxylase